MKTLRFTETIGIRLPAITEKGREMVQEALSSETGAPALEVEFAAIHEGLTRNNTYYTREGLTHKTRNAQGQPGGLESWTNPYPAPLLKDHEANADNTIGRAVSARWVEAAGKEPGHSAVKFRVTDPVAIDKFLRGEYLTGSVGQEVDSARCSICNNDMIETGAHCGHERGKYYSKAPKGHDNEGEWIEAPAMTKGSKRAHVIMGNVWGREYSVVAVPSDSMSKVKSMATVTEMVIANENEDLGLNILTMPGVLATEAEETDTTTSTITNEHNEEEFSSTAVGGNLSTEGDVDADHTSTDTEEIKENGGEESTSNTGEKPDSEATVETDTVQTSEEEAGSEAQEGVKTIEVAELTAEELVNKFTQPENWEDYQTTLTGDILNDPTTLYFKLAQAAEALNRGYVLYGHMGNEDDRSGFYKLTSNELQTIMSIIEDTNEDIEDELNAIKDLVLSNKSRNDLPDSAFALVKNQNGKKMRCLPYKKADGSVDKTNLCNALARWDQVAGFTNAERVKALRKLQTVARKNGLSDSVEMATLQGQVENLQTLVAELKRAVSEKELEVDELLDKTFELESAQKAALAEQIVTCQEVSDEERETKIAELLTKETTYLQGTLDNLLKTQSNNESMIVSTHVPNRGLALEKGNGSETEGQTEKSDDSITGDLILRAKFGDPRAKQELAAKTLKLLD